MASIALSFNNVDLTPIDNGDGQIWVTSSELAKALNYKRSDKVTQIYNRNADEFTESMTLTLKMGVKGFGNGNSEKEVRLFSLRGCHLIAMFASTDVAKKFRKWVLDILDAHVANEPTYKLGDLQRISDQIDAEYAIGFSVASVGGKAMNEWKGKKHKLEAKKEIVQELMQPLLTGFDEAKLVEGK